mmetsp:Transcript_20422/g.47263  ORF Transcript_20422/g.47263 Transcript_20422/m.47263 type:complete len:235 (+) Transcript_20422:82-786(+)
MIVPCLASEHITVPSSDPRLNSKEVHTARGSMYDSVELSDLDGSEHSYELGDRSSSELSLECETCHPMVEEMLRNQGSSEQIYVHKVGRRYSMLLTNGVVVQANVLDDMKSFVLSTIVYDVKMDAATCRCCPSGTVGNQLSGTRTKRASVYSLMTKMMKYNTILNSKQEGSQMGMRGGRFVYFQITPLRELVQSQQRKQKAYTEFNNLLVNFLEQAAQMKEDFRTRPCCPKNKT